VHIIVLPGDVLFVLMKTNKHKQYVFM